MSQSIVLVQRSAGVQLYLVSVQFDIWTSGLIWTTVQTIYLKLVLDQIEIERYCWTVRKLFEVLRIAYLVGYFGIW